MVKLQKIIKVVDAICDCVPVVSSITNGAQLLYKLARKTDATANPVKTTWKDDIKIHVINKSKVDCLIGMIPLIGNLTNFVHSIIEGLRDDLMYAVVNSEIEVIKLYLARHPLNDDTKATKILEQAAFSSKPEAFELIFNSRKWDIHSIVKALRSCWCPNASQEKNANLILDFYDMYLKKSEIHEDSHISSITDILKDFIEKGMTQTASRILNILPQCDFDRFKDILAKHSYRSYSSFRSKEGVLTEDLIEDILKRCKPCSLIQLNNYCLKVHYEKEALESDIDFNNNRQFHPDRKELNKQKILNQFHEIHYGIIQKLLYRVVEVENSADIIHTLSSLANNGETQLLDMFLVKYEDKLTSEDKVSIIKITRQTLFDNGPALKGLEHFFTKYNQDLTDKQCIELIHYFSKLSVFNNTPIIDKIIEIRPSLKDKKADD